MDTLKSPYLIKPVSAALVSYGLNKYYLKIDNASYLGTFAVCTGIASVLAVTLTENNLLSLAGENNVVYVDRVVEIGASSSLAYLANKYLADNKVGGYNSQGKDSVFNVGSVILLSSIASELISDYINVRPLEYLA